MPDARHIDAERVLGGRYRLSRPIARGGMAEVWEAHDEVLGRRVAVKVLHPHLAADEAFLARFRREAIAAARLAHPNIVATFDTGVDDGVAYIVMELVDGHTLRQELAEQGALTPVRAIHIASQVADALDYAHSSGVIHRDVKPGNILLTEDERVKVADFGIAKAAIETLEDSGVSSVTGDLTQSGAIVGTAKYLSPEQVNGEPVDGRSDVYALGVLLYEMLCGRAPFVGDTDVAVAMQHATATPLSPRQVRAGIPRPLEAIVLRAMAKTPERRYPTAAELHTALLSIDLGPDDAIPAIRREDTPPRGTPPTFAQSERSWIVPVVAIVVLAVTLGVVGVLFARSDTGQRLLNRPDGGDSSSEASRVNVLSAGAFDPPPGSGEEHDEELRFLIDGDPATTWSTEQYGSRQFGGLKRGVGFVLNLNGAPALRELEVTSPARGWSASVYVADGLKSSVPPEEWGEAVASGADISGDVTFELGGKRGSVVLVWITDLGPENAVSVGDVRLTS